MFIVLVRRIGTSSAPCVSIQMLPVISPVPFRTQVAAGTFSRQRSPPCGRIAVTPVRAGPSPGRRRPVPLLIVTCPTRTPFTSVMALRGPGAISPTTMPRSRARLRGALSSAGPGEAGAAAESGAPVTSSAPATLSATATAPATRRAVIGPRSRTLRARPPGGHGLPDLAGAGLDRGRGEPGREDVGHDADGGR